MTEGAHQQPSNEHSPASETEEVQIRLGYIFNRCGRLIEQAEEIFPEEDRRFETITQRDAYNMRTFGTAKIPGPHYVFLYKDGRKCWMSGDRIGKAEVGYLSNHNIEEKTVRMEDFQGLSFTFKLNWLERRSLGIPISEAILEMKRIEDETIRASIRDHSAKAMGQLLSGQDPASVALDGSARSIKILEKCSQLLSQSPEFVTNYMQKDIRGFGSQNV